MEIAKNKFSPTDTSEVDVSAGFDIEFRNLRFSVPSKEILKGISGHCKSGRILAILGQSGAGKSTFLDILACNPTPGGSVEGEVLVNGFPRQDAKFRKAACYVMQRDVLQASATVRESILTSALLKLPISMTRKEKEARVDSVLEELGLIECQHVRIGDELLGIKGVSGGQRRRVSIGIELIKDPKAIFLDECTSGLDSEMAVALVGTLKNLAVLKQKTIVLTIHQPNSLITSKFDDFMLLAGGELVYFGEWEGAVPFFNLAGLSCPQFTNPTDFFLNCLQDQANVDTLVEQQRRKGAASGMQGAQDEEAGAVSGAGGNGRAISQAGADASKDIQPTHPEVPGWYQTYVLTLRNYHNYVRNPVMLFSETAQYLFMGLFVGLMYLQLNNSVETGVSDRMASLWFGMAVLSFTPSYTAVTIWDRERVLLRREVGQAMYSVSSWFAARTIVTVPTQIIQTLLFGLVAFFMVGYALTWSNILIYLCSYALFQITSESIGVLCAAFTRNSTTAILALTFVLLLLLSFSGFLVSDIPVYFKWIRTISFLTYAYDAVVLSEFGSTDFISATGEIIPGSDLVPSNTDNGLSPGVNLLILLGITIATRILSYLTILGAYRFHFL
jgi:ATP-binding cassette subfamily G (WHITE) protein 2